MDPAGLGLNAISDWQARADSNLSKEVEKLKKVEEENRSRVDRIRQLEEELRKVPYRGASSNL
jgi:hypothetical protein